MLKSVMTIGTLAVASLLSVTAYAQAQLQDGGFDTQGASVADYCYTCPGGPWQWQGAGLVREGNTNWPAPTPQSSPIVVFMQGSAALQQVVTASSAGKMRVSFWITGRPQFGSSIGGNQTIFVKVNGAIIGSASTVSSQPWYKFVSNSFDMVAGTSYAISLSATAQTDQTAFIDNVGIVTDESAVSYNYDSLGRLVKLQTTGGAAGGTVADYNFDQASNRTSVKVSNVP